MLANRLTMALNTSMIGRVPSNPFPVNSSSEENTSNVINIIHANICLGKTESTLKLLTTVKEHGESQVLLQHLEEEETILHAAIKMRAHKDVISALIDTCPELLNDERESSELYRGQTALHIAITVGDVELVDTLLIKAKTQGQQTIETLLNKRATGARFENTVMMGELPLIVAALKLNTKVVDKLLEYRADLDGRNSNGDNVCHCLIRYSHLYPEKQPEIMSMCEHVAKVSTCNSTKMLSGHIIDVSKIRSQDLEKSDVHVWLMTNNDGLNPLQLAASLGQQPVFKFLMEMKGVYCYVNSEDGLFDVELYDVTDIDAISELELKSPKVRPHSEDNVIIANLTESRIIESEKAKKQTIPTLEMILTSDAATVFKFIHLSPLRYVINRKWVFYRWIYALWGILHMVFMAGFSVYAVRASAIQQGGAVGNGTFESVNKIGEDGFVTCYAIISLFFAVLYLLQEIVRTLKGRMPWNMNHVINCYHNGPFRLMLLLFSLTVFADFIWRLVDPCYGNFLLVCAMILGWWFIVFFLRGIRQFSFFTVMIQKILVGDMFRFSIVISMELIAFTTGIFIAFQGSNSSDENVSDYAKLIILMFKLMFGFTSLDVLFEARHPWFAVCLYTTFVLLTYVLMINSLIAMMSNTCNVVSQNRDIQYRVQQLSIILFFESILPGCCLRLVGKPKMCDWYDSEMNCFVRRRRYFMEVRSLHEVTKSRSRQRPNPDTMLETIFHTIKNIHLPLISELESGKESKIVNPTPTEICRENLESAAENVGYSKEKGITHNAKSQKKHKKKRSKKPKSEALASEFPSKETHDEIFAEELMNEDEEKFKFSESDINMKTAEFNPNIAYTGSYLAPALEVHPFAHTGED